MFDISWGELVLIGMVALIVIGPKELPTVLRTVGQWATKVRRMAAEFQGQFQEAMREAEMADLKKQVDDIGGSAQKFTDFNPIDTIRREVAGAFDDKTMTPPPSDPLASADAPPAAPIDPVAPAPDPSPSPEARAGLDGAPAAQPAEPPPSESSGGRAA